MDMQVIIGRGVSGGGGGGGRYTGGGPSASRFQDTVRW